VRRRDLIIGVASLGVVGAGGAFTAANRRFGEDGVTPVVIETLDAPGSNSGTMEIPELGSVTVVDFFATSCRTCREMMGPLGEVHDAVDEQVQFVSITIEPVGHVITRKDVSDWWRSHNGAWTVGLDNDFQLMDTFEVTTTPTTIVLDEENFVTYSETGRKATEELVQTTDKARTT
jgi:thiol-disulfide isomerase/thioredoxin